VDREKRKDHRQPLKYPAKIDIGDGSPHLPCLLIDVSASGARVTVEDPGKIPGRFPLLLAAEHGTQRRCKVMWRDDNQLGLVFIKPPAEKSGHRPGIILSTRHP
jgi:PilZ domain-containing protein